MIYADYNATTPIGKGAQENIQKAIEDWGNPSSAHQVGQKAKKFLENCRNQVAKAVEAKPQEVVFTSGGSEAATMAICGSFLRHKEDYRLLTTPVEHSCVDQASKMIEGQGATVNRLSVNASGALDLDELKKQLEEFKPHLVSIMTANNETGVVFPIPEIAKLCKDHNTTLHTDAVQALDKVPASFFNMADMFSISAHKIFGPKGVGALIIRNNTPLIRINCGGNQEIKRRGGTENMIGIAGFAGACANLATQEAITALKDKRDLFETSFKEKLSDITIQGEATTRLPNTSNIRFPDIGAEILLSALDLDGICVSAGSACSSGSITPSHVLIAIGMSEQEAKESIRFSWGCPTTEDEVKKVAERVISHVTRIRERRKTG